MDNNPLIRDLETDELQTVVIIGAGAVENGWEPVRKFCNEYHIERNNRLLPFSKWVLNEWIDRGCGNNFEMLLAYMGEHARRSRQKVADYFLSEYIAKYSGININPEYRNLFERQLEQDKALVKLTSCFRKNLAEYFEQGFSMSLKKIPPEIEKVIYSRSTALITTNWDNILWSWENGAFKRICCLHGRCSSYESIILPTEYWIDELPWERLKEFSRRCSNSKLSFEVENYIYQNRYSWLDSAQKLAANWLEKDVQVLVWGMAFNAYDSELMSVLGQRNQKRDPKRVKIFNPNDDHKDRAFSLLCPQYKVSQRQ